MQLSHRVRRRFFDERGVNLIEAAVVMPMVLLVCFSIAEFATIFYVNLALQNGVSQATRVRHYGQSRARNVAAGVNQRSHAVGDTDPNHP